MELPDYLLTQISECKTILFLGSGASLGAVDNRGNHPPMGNGLAKLISQKFLGGKYDNSILSVVSELAISESNLFAVQDYIRELFEPFKPTEAHLLMSTLKWWAIASTNYDLLVEKAYRDNPKACQNLAVFIENGDRVESKLRDNNSIPYLKLHGCITKISNKDCPLILTPEQYIQYKKGRDRIFDHFEQWAYELPVIFIGYSLQDNDFRTIILSLCEDLGDGRPRYYIVTPYMDEVQTRFWESKKITSIKCTFSEFIKTIDSKISSPFRVIVPRKDHKLPITENFKTQDFALTENFIQFFEKDVDYVKSSKSEIIIDPKDFYKGYNPGWSAIDQKLDSKRTIVDQILSKHFILDEDLPGKMEFILIKGHAGSGKSVVLRRLAWDAAHELDCVCIFLRPYGQINISAIQELMNLCDKRVYLFVDNLADRVREIEYLTNKINTDKHSLTLVGAERINEWNIACDTICELVTSEYELKYLSPTEIDDLISMLEKFNSLGTLLRCSKEEKRKAFEIRAGRQLLVSLHEATLGKTFEEIIEDEFNNIKPPEAQLVYLTVCTLNRLQVPVRAGIVSRLHNLPFSDFEKRLFKPLEKVVYTNFSNEIRDYLYSARHPHIAEIVFMYILKDPEEKFNHFLKCLCELNIDYSDDRKAFKLMINARALIELFPDHDHVIEIYKRAKNIAGDYSYLYHQMGIYEMNRPNGNLNISADYLKKAISMADYDYNIKHSFAELNYRRATMAKTNLEKETFLKEAEKLALLLIRNQDKKAYGYHTLLKIYLLRLDIHLEQRDMNPEITEKIIKENEKILSEALQQFPDNSYILEADSKFAQKISNSERAQQSLYKAFDANPRNSLIAIRLVRSLIDINDGEKAHEILKRALDANPSEKKLHYLYAKLLIDGKEGDNDTLLHHLKRSFVPGDTNYIAQILYGRQLFLANQVDEYKEFFKKFRETKGAPELINKWRFPSPLKYFGEIVKFEGNYCFISRDGMRDRIFAFIDDSENDVWQKLHNAVRVSFNIAFTLKGPRAFKLEII